MKHLILPALFIVATSLFLIKNITVPQKKVRNSQYACEASDRDAMYEFRQKQMLANPQTGQIPQNIRQQELAFYNSAIVPFQKNTRAQNWNAVGPYNVGGRTRAFGINKDNPNEMLAGCGSGGMFKSTNGGKSWSKVSCPVLSISCLVQDQRPGKTNIWYAGTGELLGSSGSAVGAYYGGDGILKSTDGGASWTKLSSTVGTSSLQLA